MTMAPDTKTLDDLRRNRNLMVELARDGAWDQLKDVITDSINERFLDTVNSDPEWVLEMIQSNVPNFPVEDVVDSAIMAYGRFHDRQGYKQIDPQVKSLRAKYKAINRSSQVDEFRRDIDNMLDYAEGLTGSVYNYEAEENNNRVPSLQACSNRMRSYRQQIRRRQNTDEATLRMFLQVIDQAVQDINPQLPVMEQYDDPAASELEHVRDHLQHSIRTNVSTVIELIERQHYDDNLVVRMATEMDRTHDYSAAPILADALEDAGFNDQEVLRALRSGASNVAYLVRHIAGRGWRP